MRNKGKRECARRYELIRRFCAQYQRPFTVLDVGAADGYFAIRLTEDFPECTVVAIEPRARIGEMLKLNESTRVLWLSKKMTVAEIRALAAVEHFDVTLALSVIHWMDEPPAESLAALRQLGDHLILELPVEPTATGQEIVQAITTPTDGVLLGYGESHLDPETPRPIYLLSQPKTGLMVSYLGGPTAHRLARSYARVIITSDFESKTFAKGKKVLYPWIRGVNLQTFLTFNGSHPGRKHIARCVAAAWVDLAGSATMRFLGHGDLMPWNVVLSGDRATLIDPKPGAKRAAHDAEFLGQLIATIKGRGEQR